MTAGCIHRFVRFVEERHTAFFVARLIMLSGVPLRRFGPSSADDDEAIRRIEATLPTLLSPDEVAEASSRLHGAN